MDAGNIDVLLIGPRVAHLAPYFDRRGFAVVACADGADAVEALEESSRHLVCLELNLGTYAAADFLALARGIQPDARYLLLDDPTKAGLILKALRAGADAYVATPPDEDELFLEVERLLENRIGTSAVFSDGPDEQLKKLRQRNAELEQRLRERPAAPIEVQAEADDETAALRAEIESLQKQLQNARDDLAYVETAATDAGDDKSVLLTEQLSRVEREKTDLEAEVVALRGEIDRRDENAGALDDERNQLFREREEAARRGDALSETVTALEAELAEAKAELDGLRSDQAAAEKETARLQDELAAAQQRLDALASEGAAEKSTLADEVAALTAAKTAAEERAASLEARTEQAEAARLEADGKAAAAVKAAEEAERKAETEAERVRAELQDEIKQAHRAAAKAEERAIDKELEHDELLAEIDRHKELVKKANAERIAAERRFRQEKLRLVEAQEQAGSAEAYQKMEAMLDELKELRALRDKISS